MKEMENKTNNKKDSPKVFISYAGEDKDRFVREFAEKLRGKGVDAWVALWEIKPGDSLVKKIFDEGIAESKFFIVILSQSSINKEWVRKELNTAIIKMIEDGLKIIPVIIDKEIEIPTALRDTVWVRINDLTSYDVEFEKILDAIYGKSDKPPLGNRPKYADIEESIPNLTKIDSRILKILGDILYEKDDKATLIEKGEIDERIEELGISNEDLLESVEILEKNGLVERYASMTRPVAHLKLLPEGFVKYCEYFLTGYDKQYRKIIAYILNEGLKTPKEIAQKVNCKEIVVRGTIDYLEEQGYLKVIRGLGGYFFINRITGTGKRYFRQVLRDSPGLTDEEIRIVEGG